MPRIRRRAPPLGSTGVEMRWAVMRWAVMRWAVVRWAVMRWAVVRWAVRALGHARVKAVPQTSAGELPDFAAEVLDAVESIPPGRVLTYGDVAEYVGSGGPRQVGQVMSRWGAAVPWWRVLRADGTPAPGLESAAMARYRAEGTPLRPGGRRVDLRRARWDGGSG